MEADIRAGLPNVSLYLLRGPVVASVACGASLSRVARTYLSIEIACRNEEALPCIGQALYARLNGQYSTGCLPGAGDGGAYCDLGLGVSETMAEPRVVGIQETFNNRCYYFGERNGQGCTR